MQLTQFVHSIGLVFEQHRAAFISPYIVAASADFPPILTSGPLVDPQEFFVFLPDMGLSVDFDDRQTEIESTAEAYHPYEYQTENNDSWAGALPVKQYAITDPAPYKIHTDCFV